MKIIAAFTTYNRLKYLKKTIETYLQTRNPNYDWVIIIADDGSTDGSLEYAKSVAHHVLPHKNRGIHYQTNQILKFCSKMDFDFAFKMDDDLIFKKPGWDSKYIQASKKTGFDHLVFHDPAWMRKKRSRESKQERLFR